MPAIFYLFIAPPRGQLRVVFRGCIPISGGWMLVCKECVTAGDSVRFKNFNHPTRVNFVVVMAGS